MDEPIVVINNILLPKQLKFELTETMVCIDGYFFDLKDLDILLGILDSSSFLLTFCVDKEKTSRMLKCELDSFVCVSEDQAIGRYTVKFLRLT